MFLLSLSHRGFDELEKKRRRRRRRKSLFLQVFQKYKRVRDLSARERESRLSLGFHHHQAELSFANCLK